MIITNLPDALDVLLKSQEEAEHAAWEYADMASAVADQMSVVIGGLSEEQVTDPLLDLLANLQEGAKEAGRYASNAAALTTWVRKQMRDNQRMGQGG